MKKRNKLSRPGPLNWKFYHELLSIGFRIAEDFNFTHAEQARVLGFEAPTLARFLDLRTALQQNLSIDAKNRVDFLLDLKVRLDAVLGSDLRAQQNWIAMKFKELDNKSPKALMTSGNQWDLVRVNKLARLLTG